MSVPAMTTASSGDAGSLGIMDSFRTKYRPGGHSFGPLERAGEAKSTSVTDATPAPPRRTHFARLCRAWIFIMSWSADQLSTDGTYDLRTRRRRRHGILCHLPILRIGDHLGSSTLMKVR